MTATERAEERASRPARQSRHDAARDAGYEPHDHDRYEGPPLTPEWEIALRESVAVANRLRFRCEFCDPRDPLPAWQGGLCRDHWDEVHDDLDEGER